MSDEAPARSASPADVPRYLLVSSHWAPLYHFGGPVRLALQYAEAAAARGVVPHALTIASRAEIGVAAARGDVPARLDPPAVVRRLSLDRRSRLARGLAIGRAAAWAWRTTRGERRVVLHICEYRAPLTVGALLALALRRRAGVEVRVAHSAFGQLQPPDGLGKRAYDALHWMLSRALPYTVLAQNGHEAALARRFFSAHRALDVTLLPLSSEVDPTLQGGAGAMTLDRHRADARAALGLPADEVVLVFLGRWVPAKGIERLMRAVAALPSPRPWLIVAGADFGIGESLHALAHELGTAARTRFMEDVSARRFAIYAASDVFVAAPILFEETMLASVEALSTGTAVLLSREADIPHVEDAGAGAVIDFSERAFAAALGRLLAERAALPARARAVHARHFDGRATARAIAALLDTERAE